MHRFFVRDENIGPNRVLIDDRGDVVHIGRVLRLRKGDTVTAVAGDGWEYLLTLELVEKDRVVGRIEDKQKSAGEPATRVTLFQGVPKGGKMDYTVQKCTELGVADIVPVFMARSVAADKGNFGKKVARLSAIAAEASKQCRRGQIPTVEEAISFAAMINRLAAYPVVLFPYENEEGLTMKAALRQLASGREEEAGLPQGDLTEEKGSRGEKIALVIGPEGGFAEEEAAALKELSTCYCVSLGRTILRTETAGPAALAMIMYELEM